MKEPNKMLKDLAMDMHIRMLYNHRPNTKSYAVLK